MAARSMPVVIVVGLFPLLQFDTMGLNLTTMAPDLVPLQDPSIFEMRRR
jgi:hypothetical protein